MRHEFFNRGQQIIRLPFIVFGLNMHRWITPSHFHVPELYGGLRIELLFRCSCPSSFVLTRKFLFDVFKVFLPTTAVKSPAQMNGKTLEAPLQRSLQMECTCCIFPHCL